MIRKSLRSSNIMMQETRADTLKSIAEWPAQCAGRANLALGIQVDAGDVKHNDEGAPRVARCRYRDLVRVDLISNGHQIQAVPDALKAS